MGLQEMQSTAFRFQNFSNNLFSKYRRSEISHELSTIVSSLCKAEIQNTFILYYYLCWKNTWFICSQSIAWNVNGVNNLKNIKNDCYALMMITGVIQTFAICHLYRLLWPWYSL